MSELARDDALRLARFSLDCIEEAALWSDRKGNLAYANESAAKTLGYTAHELLTLTVFQIMPELTAELWEQLLKETKSRGQFTFEFNGHAKDGRSFPIEMSVHYLPLPQKVYLCAFFRDIHEQKRLQQL